MPVVSSAEGFVVLGTKLTLSGRSSAELDARIAAAWGKFHQIWPLLKRRDASLRSRLQLFDSVVGQTALWCCESWVITKSEKQRLDSTVNEMLRRIVGKRRRPDEEWV
eukprot:10812419-Karenia_brevis.AAC.1